MAPTIENAASTAVANDEATTCQQQREAFNIRLATVLYGDARGCTYTYKDMLLDEYLSDQGVFAAYLPVVLLTSMLAGSCVGFWFVEFVWVLMAVLFAFELYKSRASPDI